MRSRGPGPGWLRPVRGWRPRAGSGRVPRRVRRGSLGWWCCVVEDVVAAAVGAVAEGGPFGALWARGKTMGHEVRLQAAAEIGAEDGSFLAGEVWRIRIPPPGA